MAAAPHPKASVSGLDGGFLAWMKGFSAELRWPWSFITLDLSRKAEPPAPDEFARIRALAATSLPGCRAARKAVKAATLRGLAAATGKPLPPGVV